MGAQDLRVIEVVVEGALGGDGPGRLGRLHPAWVLAAGQRVQLRAHGVADDPSQRRQVRIRELTHGPVAEGVQPFDGLGPGSPQILDRQRPQVGGDLAGTPVQQPVRLGPGGEQLGDRLGRPDPDRARQVDLLADPGAEVLADHARLTEQTHGPGDVEEGLVERQRFDQRGDIPHDRHDLPGRLAVVLEAVRNDDQIRAQPPGAHHRHRRVDPEPPRLVGRRRDHAPASGPTDHDRTPTQGRIVALLDRGVERVHVDVQDRLRMTLHGAHLLPRCRRHDRLDDTRERVFVSVRGFGGLDSVVNAP